ncbi:hypothetical protein SPKIRA_36840 (plasmid) [Sphingomonas paucimobilis]|uniref:DcrB-related protein n=1 Tax=Sphingomonas paucimobilis TaxID=13689 RepID=UPI0015DD1D29|nr:DcrB-related protein [Sphingomonas paucimobilis]BCI72854.1 hypothetical protein SPKIRA_36840 [Sphingomonas paucimobilis]
MAYRIDEGSLGAPTVWQDQSINVLMPKDARVQGTSLVIARDRLALGLTFQDYVIQQRQSFAAQLAGFELIADTGGQIDGHEAHFGNDRRSDGKPIHQVVAMVLHRDNAILNFTGSIPGGPEPESRNALVAAITSFTFATA